MIRFLCPGCERKLAVADEKGGKVGSCPGCKTRFQIPDAVPAEDADVELGVTAEPPARQRPARSTGDDDSPRPRRRQPVEDDDDDIPEAEVARPKKKKRKKRRRDEEGSGLPLGLDWVTVAIIGAIVVALPIIGLSLVFAPLMFLGAGIGLLMTFAGRIWFLAVAFQDDSTQGVLCLMFPIYSLIYLVSNFDECKKPFFVEMAGLVIAVLAFCAGGFAGGPGKG